MKPRPVCNPPNPWTSLDVEYLPELDESPDEAPRARLQVYEDATRRILAENDSPDVGFRYSVNPYRGCTHACAYCYARPTHEYLGFGAGTDFDTKIAAKLEAPRLLREAFERRSWKGETVVFSGVTDCYQPLEASYRLTRGCLEVCAEYRNPVGVITKAPLVERDLDVLGELHRVARVGVMVSLPFLDAEKARAVEPWVATPERRLRTIERLAKAGIPVGVMVAPVIPGLSDEDVVRVLEAARAAGASRAGWVLLRLPGSVLPVFEERIRAAFPRRANKILARVRETRDGAAYQSAFGLRQRGQGVYAATIATLFEQATRRLGYETHGGAPPDEVMPGQAPTAGEPSTFRRPEKPSPQLRLF